MLAYVRLHDYSDANRRFPHAELHLISFRNFTTQYCCEHKVTASCTVRGMASRLLRHGLAKVMRKNDMVPSRTLVRLGTDPFIVPYGDAKKLTRLYQKLSFVRDELWCGFCLEKGSIAMISTAKRILYSIQRNTANWLYLCSPSSSSLDSSRSNESSGTIRYSNGFRMMKFTPQDVPPDAYSL